MLDDIFVKSKIVKLADREIKVFEVTAENFYKFLKKEIKDESELLFKHIEGLTEEEFKKLNLPAYEKLLKEFFEINKEHFTKSEKGEKAQAGK